ncbi:hypothetical protein TNCV_1701071 [Trichonephila clavipes]|nr:hypothetical protein TNCV_1701071 [Trichonephila clavipes]
MATSKADKKSLILSCLGGKGNLSGLILVFSSGKNLQKDLCERESTSDEFDAMWKVVLTWRVLTLQRYLSHVANWTSAVLHFYYQAVSKSLFHLEEMQENQGPHQWLLAHSEKPSNRLDFSSGFSRYGLAI